MKRTPELVPSQKVATVLTACGIETSAIKISVLPLFRLQQYLPLAVLKQSPVDLVST